MSQSCRQSFSAHSSLHSEASRAGSFFQNDPTSFARSAFLRSLRQIDTVRAIRRREIEKIGYLIEELKFLQPTDVKELTTALGQTPNTTREHLRKLARLGLVVNIRFEQHSLYCLNGDFNLFIEEILTELHAVA